MTNGMAITGIRIMETMTITIVETINIGIMETMIIRIAETTGIRITETMIITIVETTNIRTVGIINTRTMETINIMIMGIKAMKNITMIITRDLAQNVHSKNHGICCGFYLYTRLTIKIPGYRLVRVCGMAMSRAD